MGKTRIVDWMAVSADRWTIIFPYGHAFDEQRLTAGLTTLLAVTPTSAGHGLGLIWENRNALQGEARALASLDRDLGSNNMIVRFSQGARMGLNCQVVRAWRDGT